MPGPSNKTAEFPGLTRLIQDSLGMLKVPLYIGWTLTYRCNQRCVYCKEWRKNTKELTTAEVFKIVDELAVLGTKVICFSGGEVMLRKDFGRIIDRIHARGISVDVNSNGSFVKERAAEIKNVRILTLSFDGPAEVHDRLRGRGSHDRVLEAARTAKKLGIEVYLRTVISRDNLDSIDYVLSTGKKLGVKSVFQPSTPDYYGSVCANPFAPSPSGLRKVIGELIRRKENGDAVIYNSLPVLKYLLRWPHTCRISCPSARIMFGIKPDGFLYPCTWGRDLRTIRSRDCRKLGVKKAIETLPEAACSGCGNASSLEFMYRLYLLLQRMDKRRLLPPGKLSI